MSEAAMPQIQLPTRLFLPQSPVDTVGYDLISIGYHWG